VNPLRRLFPEQGSTMAGEVDALFYFLCGVSILVAGVLAVLIIAFAIRYRARGKEREPMRGVGIEPDEMKRIEALWIGGPLVIFLVIFYWGAKLFVSFAAPPADAMQIFVVGKQWMWKAQHLDGRREINELHLPLGRAVKLTMTSEDVIHSFFVPAFRVKTDVLPGRYTTMWFQPTKVGEHHLFCAEYCGTKHSKMIGKIVVMEPKDFQGWLSQGGGGSLSEVGEKLFNELGCNTCHTEKSDARGPRLRGLYGRQVALGGGDTAMADESYLRESILDPRKKVVAGYQPLMPTYVTQLNEEKVVQLIAYIRSLEVEQAPPLAASAAPVAGEASDAGAEGGAEAAPSAGAEKTP
jgi:cytochrome c oxidase subunit II